MSLADMHRSSLVRLKEQEAALRKELYRHQVEEANALEDERRQMASAWWYQSNASPSRKVA